MHIMNPTQTIITLFVFCVLIALAVVFRVVLFPKLSHKAVKILQIIAICCVIGTFFVTGYTVFFAEKENISDVTETSGQWQVEQLNYEKMHLKSNGSSQTIAIIDSGISEFQKSQVISNVNFTQDNTDFDTNGHGTMMCSLLLGYKENITGIAPEANIRIYKVVSADGKIEAEILAKAINKAIDDNVTIINISLGSYKLNDDVREAINRAYQNEIIVVAASGDYNANDMLYPAKMEQVVSVGAINEKGIVWEDTNAIQECDILAPGVSVLTINNEKDVFLTNGTSQATAIISGYISLLKDYSEVKGKELMFSDIQSILGEINHGKASYLDGFDYIDKLAK